jgi:hypothetical protein
MFSIISIAAAVRRIGRQPADPFLKIGLDSFFQLHFD